MNIKVTSIADSDVFDKIDLEKIGDGIRSKKQPNVFNQYAGVCVTVVCRAPNDFENEVWEEENQAFVTITLPYHIGKFQASQTITTEFISRYQAFVGQVRTVPTLESLEANSDDLSNYLSVS